MTILYSVLHLLVDGVCALAMFGSFLSGDKGYFYILVYNFCAFALQMPIGAALDTFSGYNSGKENNKENIKENNKKNTRENRKDHKKEHRKKSIEGDPAFLTAAAGAFCTVLGAFTHPAVLGLGNALFHVGGGVGCIREDHARHWRGRGLGVFVAPGALGLYLGTLIAKGGQWKVWVLGVSVLMLFLCLGVLYGKKLWGRVLGRPVKSGNLIVRQRKNGCQEMKKPENGYRRTAALLCLAVVILRSYIGMSVSFSWKTGILAGILAVLALVAGKMAGGFAGARYGFRKTAVVSLFLAGIFYLFSSFMPMGLAALFFFNMTMPITLYWMVCSFPQMPGFAFGFLTFALFLGFLPEYFGWQMVADGKLIGSMGSLLSLLLLWAGLEKGGGCDELSD